MPRPLGKRTRSVEEAAEREINRLHETVCGLNAEIRTRVDDAVEKMWRATACLCATACPRRPPRACILDDALVYSDDDRIEKMVDALHRQSRDQQIIPLLLPPAPSGN